MPASELLNGRSEGGDGPEMPARIRHSIQETSCATAKWMEEHLHKTTRTFVARSVAGETAGIQEQTRTRTVKSVAPGRTRSQDVSGRRPDPWPE
jgi:hypothetical protein